MADLDIRQELDVDSGAELSDDGGPSRADLRFTDFSKDALADGFLPWSEAYLPLCIDGWAREVAKHHGAETMAGIEWAAWNDPVVPEIEVGLMTFHCCVAAAQWAAMGRSDILAKNCHSTCPESMIVTTRLYHRRARSSWRIPPGWRRAGSPRRAGGVASSEPR